MIVLKTKSQLLGLKKMLDTGEVLPAAETVFLVRGVLHSVLSDLWDYEAVVDQWPETPRAIILRPVHTSKLPFINRNVYMTYSDENVLYNLLKEDNVLAWNEPMNFEALSVRIVDMVLKVAQARGGDITYYSDHQYLCYVRDRRKSFSKFDLPHGFKMRPVHPSEASLVVNDEDDVAFATRHPEECTGRFDYYIRHLPSCIIHNPDGKPVGWKITSLSGEGEFFYIVPEYRRKGFGLLINKYWGDCLAEMGRDEFAYVYDGNVKAVKPYRNVLNQVGEHVVLVRYEPKVPAASFKVAKL